MPKYAERTFKSWFRERERNRRTEEQGTDEQKKEIENRTGKQGRQNDENKATANPEFQTPKQNKVILWADTFNNYFLPQTLVAGVEVLEAAGFEVIVPKKSMCCGRPLYDFGMLKTAKRMLLDIMENLYDEIRDGVPIVGLEPSCVAVFRDELHNLFPHNEQASRLSKQVFTLGEFLERKAPDFQIPEMHRKALVHGHCHHRSVMGVENEKKILEKTNLAYEVLPTTCCGMAGYFGYEKGSHYDVSIKAGEQLLLPKVREADADTVIVTDGFSCREQIEQETDRKGLHLAQVLQMGMREQRGEHTGALPEKRFVDGMALKNPHKLRNRVLLLGAVGIGFLLFSWLKKGGELLTDAV
ncbi:MAG TPA: heterodisulfide reductase-related iron-sulfur binding cluster, partial [Flavisolibacter sp.]|nr:heterodisulfide reductase-related iron-sulfur binding cluster [Flavisolibacter sp.]